MPDTPYHLRGLLYPTHLFARCPNYHQCRRCLLCEKFNQHDPQCVVCESVKPGGQQHCECTDRQQEAIVMMENLIGRPRYDPNPKPASVTVQSEDTVHPYYENLPMLNQLSAAELPDT